MLLSMLRRALYLALALGVANAVVACGDEDSSLGGGAQASCSGQNWRQATPASVVCPGATDCACPSGQVCCVNVVDNKAVSGCCGDIGQCAGPALRCDGVEDCASGEVCCLIDTVGGGSECRAPNDCFFTDEITTCREDSECDGVEHCRPAEPGTYLAGLVAGCAF
jgi:hypothetical protein